VIKNYDSLNAKHNNSSPKTIMNFHNQIHTHIDFFTYFDVMHLMEGFPNWWIMSITHENYDLNTFPQV
jgi:hypothetical protein